jgi:hypothetical protein
VFDLGGWWQCVVGSRSNGVRPDGGNTLTATPLSSAFELDPNGTWHDTDGDHGSGDPGTVSSNTSTTTVTVNTPGTKCVWACCPFSPGGTGCPTAAMDQCP